GKRKALVISSISLALNLVFEDEKTIKDAKICIGSAAPVPLRIKKAEDYLNNKNINKVKLEKLGEIVAEEISPIDDIRGTAKYRKQTINNITQSAFREVIS
ncbi:MAG: FAD binding domain-containing protein, partial [Bacillota bacterium]